MKRLTLKSAHPEQVLALDRGSERSKCLCVTRNGEDIDISFAADIATDELTATWLKQQGLAGLPVAASFSCPSLTMKEVELPPMPEPEIADAIRWNLESTTGEPMQDYMVRYSSCEVDASKKEERLYVMAYAAKKAEIAALTADLKRLQLRPYLLEPSVVSLVGSWDLLKEPEAAGALLFLDCGHHATYLAIAHEKKLLQARTLEALPRHLKSGDMAPYYQWAVAVQNALDSYSVHFKDQPIKRIYLGGGAAAPEAVQYLTHNLGLPAEQISWAERVHFPNTSDVVKPYLFAEAMGAARCLWESPS